MQAFGDMSTPVDVNQAAFSDFLRDVLFTAGPYDQNREVDTSGMGGILEIFGNQDLELNDVDFGMLDYWNYGPQPGMAGSATFDVRNEASPPDVAQMSVNLSKVWIESPWLYTPTTNIRDSTFGEQGNLSIASGAASSAQFEESRRRLERVTPEKLNSAGRDKVLALVLNTLKHRQALHRVATCFPSADVMDTLVHLFLASHACQVTCFIHFPTVQMNQAWPEWIGMAAACGATLAPMPALRKFGFALQEAIRYTVLANVEADNSNVSSFGVAQVFILTQDMGVWSANKRKMEIAESTMQIPTTVSDADEPGYFSKNIMLTSIFSFR